MMEQYMPFIWIGFLLIMIVCEAFTTQLVSIWFVIGAACAAVTTIFTNSIIIQSVVFVAVSFVALIITRPIVKKFKSSRNKVSTNADRIIGKTGIMLSDINDIDEVGQAKVEGKINLTLNLSLTNFINIIYIRQHNSCFAYNPVSICAYFIS